MPLHVSSTFWLITEINMLRCTVSKTLKFIFYILVFHPASNLKKTPGVFLSCRPAQFCMNLSAVILHIITNYDSVFKI